LREEPGYLGQTYEINRMAIYESTSQMRRPAKILVAGAP